jgi:hypothetical protein
MHAIVNSHLLGEHQCVRKVQRETGLVWKVETNVWHRKSATQNVAGSLAKDTLSGDSKPRKWVSRTNEAGTAHLQRSKADFTRPGA